MLRFVFECNDQPTAIFTIMVVVPRVCGIVLCVHSSRFYSFNVYGVLFVLLTDIRSALHALTYKRSQRYLVLKKGKRIKTLLLFVTLAQDSALSAAILPLNNRERDSRSGNK